MDKRGASSLGVHQRKIKKHSRKKKLFKKIFDYLKSDSFLFAPLVSSQPSVPPTKTLPTATAGVEIMKPHEDENKKLVDKVGDYLKSDSYLYAPLIGPQPSHGVDANIAGPHSDNERVLGSQCLAVSPVPVPNTGTFGTGSVRLLKRVTAEVSTRIITKKTNLPTEDTLNVIGGDEPSENTRFKNRLAVQRSVAHRETLKHAVHQHCRSSIPGSGILATEPRKLVVE
ncbi:hypothetical protein RHGRI_000112 [Rhododendron griersonianum]|uniref:Uncharacterized protein n=1 Tax=Rhododendron griersonianum TaxID=479676 RepID=A0AAV6LIJ3_9ERIC|nr:hypothetical protein RHGRI_000112 [Rhododendron griersonianum]